MIELVMFIYPILLASFGLSIILHIKLSRILKTFLFQQPEEKVDFRDLPTVSICIPARNEMHAMTDCLERVTASTYPKLEIIVLDDSSVDETSHIIKSFAHAGVRFVEGSPLPADWLGKAHAQATLLKESSGEFILYLDVDTKIAPQTIDQLIAAALSKSRQFISILPQRRDGWRASVLLSPLRHLWVLMSHRAKRPAAVSNAWLVKREFLDQNFANLSDLRLTVEPERLIAKTAMEQSVYQFYISNQMLGISYEKRWRSQCETSIRLLFPQFGGRFFQAAIGFVCLVLLLLVFILPLDMLVYQFDVIHLGALINVILMILFYLRYTKRVWINGWLVGGLLLPFILLQEIILLMFSIITYTSGVVSWKGRPVRASARQASRRQLRSSAIQN